VCSKKLKLAVFLDADISGGGGFQTQISSILELKNLERYSVSIFTFSRKNIEQLTDYGLSGFLIKRSIFSKFCRFFSHNLYSFFLVRKLKILSKFEKDLIRYNIDLVYFLSPSFLALELVRLKYIFTIWDLCHRDSPEFPEVSNYRMFEQREFLYTLAPKKAIAVITDSEAGRKNAIARYGLDHNRVYAVSFSPSENIKINPSKEIRKKYEINGEYIYYPAQLWPHKNHIYIIDCIQILRESGIEISAIFSGSDKGNLSHVLNYAKKNKVDDLIKYIGFAPNNLISSLYKNALALTMPTYFGQTNIPPLEAFSLGTPVIYSDLDGIRDQVGNAALLCDLSNPMSMAKHIESLLTSKSLRHELAEKGYKRLKDLRSKSMSETLSKVLDDYEIKSRCWSD